MNLKTEDKPEWRYKVTIGFKKEDCWIGVYWKKMIGQLDIWICIIPCFPIHIQRNRVIYFNKKR